MSTVGTSCWKYPGPFGSWPSSALRSFIHRGLSARHLVRFGSVGVILASSIRPFGSWPSSTLYSSLHYELSARHVVGGIGGAHQGSSTNPPPTHHGVIKRVENHQQSTPPTHRQLSQTEQSCSVLSARVSRRLQVCTPFYLPHREVPIWTMCHSPSQRWGAQWRSLHVRSPSQFYDSSCSESVAVL